MKDALVDLAELIKDKTLCERTWNNLNRKVVLHELAIGEIQKLALRDQQMPGGWVPLVLGWVPPSRKVH